MNPFSFLYTELIYRPLLNGLMFFYTVIPGQDLGVAMIALIIAIRLLLHRSIARAARMQRIMPELQSRLRSIQENAKGNKETQAKETLAAYRAYGIHPLSFITPLLVQIPVFFGIYKVFSQGIQLAGSSELMYLFIPRVASFNPIAFGFFDFTKPSWLWAIAAGASQFLQGYLAPKPPELPATKKDDFGRMLRWQMTYLFPVFFIVISIRLPAAVAFGWTVFSLVAILQQTWIDRGSTYERARTLERDAGKDGDPRRD